MPAGVSIRQPLPSRRAAVTGVRVSTVFPGRTATAMQEQVHAMEGRDYDPSSWVQPGTVAERVIDLIDLPRDATVTELVIRPS